ncbi:SPOR domain-containing protein [Fibrobacter sp. UBA2449]|uniref:SPOR domain-containing protein n=1 Tax=Fibrobacter sp. UBA2449 TaxID=1946529 RepID=UPI0025C5E3C5|nr:SPOR domain-containing protein [Fibrobacter sp. UBA2449]
MKMKFWNVRGFAAILFLICSTSAFAQPEAQPTAQATTPSIADAQKAYVAGKWKDAATAYEAACPREPDSVRAECYLWNVLALSQTGNAKDFSKAGKRLDSLIGQTNPQHKVYADLMMTKAQFQLYMGRHAKAAEALIHAIETSQPHQVVVLKKICAAVQPKVKQQALNEACARLDEPQPAATVPDTAKPAPAATDSVKDPLQSPTQPPEPPKPVAAADSAPAPEVKPAPEVQPETIVPDKAPSAATESWILQLGAFGVKSNADLLVSNLKKRGIAATIEERAGETKTLYLVQTGPFETKEKAVDFGAKKLAPINVEFRAILKK